MKECGAALSAENIRVNGNVSLSDGFQAEGEVWLLGAQIGGNIDCRAGIFKNPSQKDVQRSGTALTAENVSVNGNVSLRDGFQAEGEVWLLGAQIRGNLDCSGGIFKNPSQKDLQESAAALNAQNARITGDVFLREGFQAEGEVNLLGIGIDGDLDCDGGKFHEVSAGRARIKHHLFWRNLVELENTTLDLRAASIGSLADDRNSWPKPGAFLPDGFSYGRIAFGPKDAKSRLEWLSRVKSFTPQPYRQLAKVLREEGDDLGARRVLYEMEKRKHREARHGSLLQLWNVIFRGTIGYGIYPRRALWWLLLLIILGGCAYRRGYSRGAITPTNKEAYEAFHSNAGPPPNYQHFSP